jgi:hypothetical protein
VGLVLGGIIAGVYWFTTEYGGQAPSFQATIDSVMPLGPSQVLVNVAVGNLTTSPLTPTCRAEMSSADNTVTGKTTFTGNEPIPGRSSTDYSITVLITANSAHNVTAGASTVTCN